jgi:predicted nucleic acid-binding protein
MSRVYVSDTNIWIDFRNAGLLDALFKLPLRLCCTDFVVHELMDLNTQMLRQKGLLVETLEGEAISRLFGLMAEHNNSSLADVSCYLLARDTGRPLLTGDGRLRKQATQDGLQVHRALWLLDQLVAHGVIDAAAACKGLQAMLLHGARLPAQECRARLTLWRPRP